MLQILQSGRAGPGGLSRREMLRVGGLGLGGVSLSALLAARARAAISAEPGFGRARSCILLYMVGGPPQHETWDPKPEAPAEIRGPFGALSTPVDGLQVGELMPRLARQAGKCAVLRAMATDVNAHTGSGYWMLTGHPHPNRSGESIPPSPADWPHLGAVARRHLAGEPGLPPVVTLPEQVKNNPGIVVAGQNAGFMSSAYEPFLLECDPAASGFSVPGLSPVPGLSRPRLERRRTLLSAVNRTLDGALRGAEGGREERLTGEAFDLLVSPTTRRAFALDEEAPALRDRYGRHKFGQSCLLARRLVEAGVRLVTVNWPREPNDFGKGNPVWDTHSDNAGRLKNDLMPPMDQGVSALLEDLEQRGLLGETLVIWMGEFGRTPRFNPQGGRDHWGHVFPVVLAGGGVRAGMVYGESDRLGAFPERDRVEPSELHATLYHCLGIPPGAEITDRQGRPLFLYEAEPLRALF